MREKRILPVFLMMILLLVAYTAVGCANINREPHEPGKPSGNSAAETSAAATVSEAPPTPVDVIAEKIKSMSLDEKIGQLVIAGIDGYQEDENSKLLIGTYKVGGFILFKRNIKSGEQMLALLNSIKEQNSENDIPLLLSIDEEGGRVSRMPEEFLRLPSNKKIGQSDDSELSYQIGSILGEELKAFGLNMNFAPVLDINSNPKNPVIGDRAFGAAADIVTRLGVSTMQGIREQNVIPVVKHFPGHGDTAVDSHVGLPVVNHSYQRLKEFELLPFAAAIENGAEAVMVAHILLPEIDADNPSSMSPSIITGILREDLGFEGVVITDDFTMGAIVKNYGIGAAAVKSIQAGSDIVLVCHGFKDQLSVLKALKNAVQNGELTEERIEQSVYRILTLKDRYQLSDQPAPGINTDIINKKISALLGKSSN